MATDVPSASKVPPHQHGLWRRILDGVNRHTFFWIAVGIGAYLFLGAPQIKNIWNQWPRGKWLALYLLFFVPLVWIYIASVLNVLGPPIEITPPANWRSSVRTTLRWVWFVLKLPSYISQWLLFVTQGIPREEPSRPFWQRVRGPDKELLWSWGFGLPLIVAAIVSFAVGAEPGTSRGYPLMGAACQGLGMILAGIGLWFVFRPFFTVERVTLEDGSNERSTLWNLGRLLGWLLLTAGLGELLWILASTEGAGYLVSYRLYTIWAVAQALAFIMLMGLLVDRLHRLHRNWPVRPLAVGLMVMSFWIATRWETLSPNDADQFIRGKGEAADTARSSIPPDKRAALWFAQFKNRLDAIPEKDGPVILVAASGGGSRAAIFSALALETLARTPIDPKEPMLGKSTKKEVRTWADNTVMISSASGGSLATAYYVHRLRPISKDSTLARSHDDPLANLRNTTESELIAALEELSNDQLKTVVKKLAEQATDRENLLSKATRIKDLLKVPTREALGERFLEMKKKRDKWSKELDALKEDHDQLATKEAQLDAKTRNKREADRAGIRKIREAELGALEDLSASVYTDLFVQHLGNHSTPLSNEEQEISEWVLKSQAFDEMCLDFMAPIMRGVLSPTLGRGDALGRFWSNRFDWYNSTNFHGYAKPKGGHEYEVPAFEAYHPLVLFNACDAVQGSRLVAGFPALPNDLWKKDDEDATATKHRIKSLNEHDPNFRIGLGRAVRLSSNFPFGFRVLAVQGEDRDKVIHMVDGGVVDNTGLDTVHEIFRALNDHADGTKLNRSAYYEVARDILKKLRKRGVIIFEVELRQQALRENPQLLRSVGRALGTSRRPDQCSLHECRSGQSAVREEYPQHSRPKPGRACRH